MLLSRVEKQNVAGVMKSADPIASSSIESNRLESTRLDSTRRVRLPRYFLGFDANTVLCLGSVCSVCTCSNPISVNIPSMSIV